MALSDAGAIKLKAHPMACDNRPIDTTGRCGCAACISYSRAALHLMFKGSSAAPVACQLVTAHNLAYMLGLTRRMRNAILEGRFAVFVREFLSNHFCLSDGDRKGTSASSVEKSKISSAEKSKIPAWVVDALGASGCDWEGACG